MSISYNKTTKVVLLVQEGDEAPREATEEDLLRAGYVPAVDRVADFSGKQNDCQDCTRCGLFCEQPDFVSDNGIEIEVISLEDLIGESLHEVSEQLKKAGKFVKRESYDRIFGGQDEQAKQQEVLDDMKANPLRETLFSVIDELEKARRGRRPVMQDEVKVEESLPDVLDFEKGLNDIFEGLDTDFPEFENNDQKTASSQTDPVKNFFSVFEEALNGKLPESKGLKDAAERFFKLTDEEVKADEKADSTPEAEEAPEFNEAERRVIDKMAEMGLGEHAAESMRKSKEFTQFLYSNKPTPEEMRRFLSDKLGKNNPFGF